MNVMKFYILKILDSCKNILLWVKNKEMELKRKLKEAQMFEYENLEHFK